MTDINALILESLEYLSEDNPAVLQNNYQKPTYPINYQQPTYNYNSYYQNSNFKSDEDEEKKKKTGLGGILGGLALAGLGAGAGWKLSTSEAPKAAYYGLKGKFSSNPINKFNNYMKAAKHGFQSPMIRKMALKKITKPLFG